MVTGSLISSFLSGAVFMAALACSLFFFRFWKETRDRFFWFFALAFFMFGIERITMLIGIPHRDTHGSVYLLRLAGFVMIIGAIVHKNRSSSRK